MRSYKNIALPLLLAFSFIASAGSRNDDVGNISEVGDGRFTWGARDEHPGIVNPVLATQEDRDNILSLRGEWEFSAKPMHRAPFRNITIG